MSWQGTSNRPTWDLSHVSAGQPVKVVPSIASRLEIILKEFILRSTREACTTRIQLLNSAFLRITGRI
jgi:hypothetical protein